MTLLEFARGHLEAWAAATLDEDGRAGVIVLLWAFVEEHPEVLDREDWPTIRRLAERAQVLARPADR